MKLRRLLATACAMALAGAAAQAQAADCRPDPLAGRVLYVRGTFNDWRADDEAALHWLCDHYEIVGPLTGDQSFKIADEDWSDDVNFGAADGTTEVAKWLGPQLHP